MIKDEKKRMALIAVLIIIAVIISLIIVRLTEPELVQVTDDGIAMVKVTLDKHCDTDVASYALAEAIYETANKYLEVKKIIVSVYMSCKGLYDKHGNSFKEDMFMGRVIIDNVDEVREHTELGKYFLDNRFDFRLKILPMHYSNVLIYKPMR